MRFSSRDLIYIFFNNNDLLIHFIYTVVLKIGRYEYFENIKIPMNWPVLCNVLRVEHKNNVNNGKFLNITTLTSELPIFAINSHFQKHLYKLYE